MYFNSEDVVIEKQRMLDEMFNILKSSLPTEAYAMKGGYTLSAILNTGSSVKNFRRTSDIDLDVTSKDYFRIITDSLIPLLDSWVKSDKIYKYSISEPRDRATGNIKLYRKRDANTKAFIFCGVDIAIHPLSYGIMMLEGGLPCYSIERMLADKFWSMYFTSNGKMLYHRIRDILDIYLIGRYLNTNGGTLNEDLLASCVKKRMEMINVSKLNAISNFELLFQSHPESVVDVLKEEIEFRISPKMTGTLSVKDVISDSLAFINFVLGVVG